MSGPQPATRSEPACSLVPATASGRPAAGADGPTRLHVNYEYCLAWAAAVREANPAARILDYGCGAGEVVRAGLERGLDIFGADEFYGGASSREIVKASGLLGGRVREIRDGVLDFDAGWFDLVLSNQVFEHVADLDRVLDEVWRVLKRDGRLVALFPSNKVIREGHVGLPFVHWLPPTSRLRYRYALGLRSLGLGYFKAGKTRDRWTRDALDWLDRYTYYRPEAAILRSVSRRFDVQAAEGRYAAFRLARSPLTSFAAPVARWPGVERLVRSALRRLGGMVLVATKRDE